MAWISGHNYTSDRATKFARLRVDAGQTGFFEGREFRSFLEFSIAAGASVWGKFVSPCDFILWSQRLNVDAGTIRYRAFTPGAEGGVFTALPVIGKNRMVERRSPYYEPRVSLTSGGTHSGGTQLDAQRVNGGVGGNSHTALMEGGERGLPAGTYYVQLENVGTGTATGVYDLWWEERPTDDFPIPYGPGSTV